MKTSAVWRSGEEYAQRVGEIRYSLERLLESIPGARAEVEVAREWRDLAQRVLSYGCAVYRKAYKREYQRRYKKRPEAVERARVARQTTVGRLKNQREDLYRRLGKSEDADEQVRLVRLVRELEEVIQRMEGAREMNCP
jgi:hypothetical protein